MESQPDHSSASDEDEIDLTSAWSLASTANDLVIEHGRQFPNYRYGSQPFPRGDNLAVENEFALHNLMLHLYDNKLYTAPVPNPRNVLDVRSGKKGLWARNMADAFPDAQVTAFDVFMQDSMGQDNLQFILQEYNDQWIVDEVWHAHGKHDFIYARSLFGGSQDYPEFYKQCLEHLEPGGYFEQTEIVPYCKCDDGVFREDSIVQKLTFLINDLEKAFSTDYDLASNMKKFIEEAGFEDVQQRHVYLPWSAWPDPKTHPREHETGRVFQKFYETGLQGWLLSACVGYLKMSKEQVDNMVDAAIIELRQHDQHWYSQCITVTARKPS